MPFDTPRDVIFKLTESNPGLFDTGADSVGRMEHVFYEIAIFQQNLGKK